MDLFLKFADKPVLIWRGWASMSIEVLIWAIFNVERLGTCTWPSILREIIMSLLVCYAQLGQSTDGYIRNDVQRPLTLARVIGHVFNKVLF